MSTIVEKLTASLKVLPTNVDTSIPIMNMIAILGSEEETSDDDLLKHMIEKKLMSKLRAGMIWHVAMNCIDELDVKCIVKMRESKLNFGDMVANTIGQLDETRFEAKANTEADAKPDVKPAAKAAPQKIRVSPPKIAQAAHIDEDQHDDSHKWKSVVGTKKAVAAAKRLVAEHTVGTRVLVPKGPVPSLSWIKPNDKPENGLDYKYIASAGYVLFPSRPPRIQNADMFSWIAVEKVVIGDNEVLIPWRKGYERNSGWEFKQCVDTEDEYIGWYKVSDDFKYTHYMSQDGVWEHYYIDEANRKNVSISDEEMYKVVARNLWKNDRE